LDTFFSDHPDAVLCGEVVGDNPYNHQRDPDLSPGAHFFLFDIVIPGRGRIPPEERYQLMEQYNLPGTPCWGEFDHQKVDELFKVLHDLNDRCREGVVMKSLDGAQIMKFVTPNKDLEDIRDGLIVNFDLPVGHFWNRIVRATLFIQEFQLDPNIYAQRIGQAFLDGLSGLDDFRRSEQDYVIYVKQMATWEATRDMIASRVRVVTDAVDQVTMNGQPMLRVRFRRIYRLSTHRFHSILKGFPHTD
jgi:putative ATP-dependent DNA ligase